MVDGQKREMCSYDYLAGSNGERRLLTINNFDYPGTYLSIPDLRGLGRAIG